MVYTIFAGVNGVGKTTYYNKVYKDSLGFRINTDEMVATRGDWRDAKLQYECGREAIRLIDSYIENGFEFNQETTLTGKSIIRNILKAKERGFFIRMIYIGVNDVSISQKRIKGRVEKGGHGIPDDVVERRYLKSLENFSSIYKECDEVYVYDNSYNMRECAIVKAGVITKYVCPDNSEWVNDILGVEYNKKR